MNPSLHTARQLVTAAALLACLGVQAQPITLVPNTLNMFRDTRGANDVGIGQGDIVQYGASIVGGSVGASVGAAYPGSQFVDAQQTCNPLAVDLNFCSNGFGYNANRLNPYDITFRRGTETLTVQGPSLAGTQQAVPFPNSVTISGTGLQPTISWQVPNTFTPDALRVTVYDKNRFTVPGSQQRDVIHSVAIDPNATSYSLPSVLSSGQSLAQGGNYTIAFQLIDLREGSGPFTNNNAQILRRSSSFFAFTPLSGDVPDDIALPTVVDGVYNFNVTEVGPSSITFIDPFVAVGYDYAIGAGDPNFASVLLPDVGDGQYTLEFTDAGGAQSVTLADGTQYFFGAGGVSAFRVTGIETEAMLDPANVTAFITGLTFVANGSFTGTQTPITVFVPVPEPQTWGLMALGLLGLTGAARARRR
jgi:hypothetical protein